MSLSNASVAKLPLSGRLERSKSHREELSRRALTTRWLGRASLGLPLVGLAAGTWLLLRSGERRGAAYGVLGASAGLGLLRWQLQRYVTEKIPYVVEARLGDIEFRRYPAQVWAETVVEHAPWSEALNEGFRRLASYIFGGNQGGESLSMTAPVFATLSAGPVAERTVAFVMPADRDLHSLPQPRDPRVSLRVVPERLVAALAFTGHYEGSLPQQKRAELLSRLEEAGLEVRGEVSFAGYDPRSTLAALRRNEVMVELAP